MTTHCHAEQSDRVIRSGMPCVVLPAATIGAVMDETIAATIAAGDARG